MKITPIIVLLSLSTTNYNNYKLFAKRFETSNGLHNIEVAAKYSANKNYKMLEKEGLICYWDFNKKNPFQSKGKFKYNLLPSTDSIELKDEGILSNNSVSLKEGQYLFIPKSKCKGLNINGESAEVTVMAWVKRQPKKKVQCEAIAGMWNETEKQRQYCLFLNIKLNNSSDQVAGHISGVGGPTEGSKWCIDVAIGKQPVPFNEWSFVAFTYDGKQIKSYINGILMSGETATLITMIRVFSTVEKTVLILPLGQYIDWVKWAIILWAR